MQRRPFRVCLGLILIFALLGMLPMRAAMALPMVTQGMTHHAHISHVQMQAAEGVSSQHAASCDGGAGHQVHCPCGGHCGLCAACHATVPAVSIIAGLSGAFVVPGGPRLSDPAELWLPLDPRPPRA